MQVRVFERYIPLNVFSQMKDIKHIRRNFHSVARGGTWGYRGGGGQGVKYFVLPKFNQIWCVSYSHEWHVQRHSQIS